MDKKGLEELVLDEEDLLCRIFNLCSLRDTIRMGAVCKSWLSVSRWSRRTRPQQLPWLMMLPNSNSRAEEREGDCPKLIQEEEGEFRCFFNLSENALYDPAKFPELVGKRCFTSFNNADARGWILTIVNHYLDVQLFHPWRRIQLQLPNYSTLPLQHPWYSSRSSYPRDGRTLKAAMSDDATTVVVINHATSALAFCRIGDNVWTHIISPRGVGYSDVIYHKGHFYAISWSGRLGVVHMNTANPYVEILTEPMPDGNRCRFYLVADSDSAHKRFFLVERIRSPNLIRHYPHFSDCFCTTSDFNVFELGFEEAKTGEYKKKPVEVESLGDLAIFLGRNSSMLFVGSQIPGFKGNQIYFTDDDMDRHAFEPPLRFVDVGIFNVEDKTIQRLFITRAHHCSSPPIWITPPALPCD